jgi:cytochrome bd ubiquinol oxidase subunit II
MNQAMSPELPAAWFFLLAFTLVLFVILDGADLGIGVLSLRANKQERSVMMDTIGPLWYANETWLVIAGAILFGAFPLAYSLVLSSLYIPVMILLFGLIFRAVSTEFMGHSDRKGLWGMIFGCGSLLAIAGQGFVLGGILSPIKVEDGLFAGGPWDWLNVISITITAGTIAAYSMLGASYLASKSEGTQAHNRKLQRISASLALVLFILSLVLAFLIRGSALYSWSPPRTCVEAFFLLAAIFGFIMLLSRSNGRARDRYSFLWSIVVFLSVAGAIVSAVYPYFIPFSLTIFDAAAPSQTLIFMLFGVGAILPVILVYNLYVRGVFSGTAYGDHNKGPD